MTDRYIGIDNIAANEGIVVGLKLLFPDEEERMALIMSMKGKDIEVFSDPSNLYDPYTLRCKYKGKTLGFIAYEYCLHLYPYLDDIGHASAHVVRIGKNNCLIVRFKGMRNLRLEKELEFKLNDDEFDIPYSEKETFLDYAYNSFLEHRSLYVAMNLYPKDYSEEEWSDLLDKMDIAVQTFLDNYQLSPCIEDREHLNDVLSICDSVLQNRSLQEKQSAQIESIQNTRNALIDIKNQYLGTKKYAEIVASHYGVFQIQCINFRYPNRYLHHLTETFGLKPDVHDLMNELQQVQNQLLKLDSRRSDIQDFKDIHNLGHLVFYMRMNRSQVYIFYKHMFRLSLLKNWIKQATNGEELQLNININSNVNLQGTINVENMTMNGDVIEAGGTKEVINNNE